MSGSQDDAAVLSSYIDRTEKGLGQMPKGLAILSIIPVVVRGAEHVTVVPAVAIGMALVLISGLGVFQHKLNRRSLKAISRLLRCTSLALAFVLAWMMWDASFLVFGRSFVTQHLGYAATVYGAVFLAALLLMVLNRNVIDIEGLRSCRVAGTIPADELAKFWPLKESSTRKAGPSAGTVRAISLMPAAIALTSFFWGRASIGFVLVVLNALLLSPYIAAIFVFLTWMQYRILGFGDLIIE